MIIYSPSILTNAWLKNARQHTAERVSFGRLTGLIQRSPAPSGRSG
jgi:hypothetical protein